MYAEYEVDNAAEAYGGNNADAAIITEVLDAQILPGNAEKSKLLNMFNDLRSESTFCDVAFLCKGTLFRAHRIVVSGWSRWLRALLSEGSIEEIVHLDVFEPLAFSAVLDYMYGAAITVTVDTAETLLKVIRRLELHGLEQSIWIFLMKAINPNNCNRLHELADRYDCPPLKLAAWRFIQQATSGPSKHLDFSSKVFKGTGLTGPGEAAFFRNISLQERADHERHTAELVAATGGIISAHSMIRPTNEDGDEEDKSQDRGDDRKSVDLNEAVSHSLEATEFIRAWSRRLHTVYEDCMVSEVGDPAQLDSALQQSQRNMAVNSRHKGAPTAPRAPVENASGSVAGGSPQRPVAGSQKLKKSAARPTRGDIDWHSELKGFYLGINLPEKLPFLDEILQANAGREDQMLSHLMMKYKRVIPQSLANHLDTLQGFLETHSESSFKR